MNLTRRVFLKKSALSAAGISAALASQNFPAPAFSQTANANEKLNLAFVGVWGQARETMGNMRSENFYALCDVDSKRLGMAAQRYPGAKHYADYRKMLEELDQIDAVIVSTPDHSHAPASLQAMRMKKHCYCEKPLAHEVIEARRMAEVAAENNLATQLGTQPNAYANYYETEEIVKSGAIGKVKEVHVWTCTGNTTGYVQGVGGRRDVGIPLGIGWGQPANQTLPPAGQTIPQELNWDLWLGPAKQTEYHECYVPANWRRWWNFGSGQLGDFGCHYMNLPIRTLQLLNAKTVKAQGPAVNAYACPEWLRVQYTFQSANEFAAPGITLNWYDGKSIPEIAKLLEEHKIPFRGNGILFVGTEGDLFANYNEHTLYPETKYADYKTPEPFIPRSIGHYKEFLEACRQDKPELCRIPFSYGGRLTETVLLGIVAYRSGEAFEWDPENFRTTSAAANALLERPYRDGWTL